MLKRQIKRSMDDGTLDLKNFISLVEKSYDEFKKSSSLNQHITDTLEREINERELRLSAALRHKNELIRILCHDFYNSVAILISTTHLVKKYKSEQKSDRLWQRVQKVSEIQLGMINHIREMEALESGKQTINITSICLEEILENINFMFEGKFADKKLVLNTEKFNSKLRILAEKNSLLNSVINNLISNSIKFSYPEARIYLESGENDDGTVVITVKDEGIGIPSKILESLFDPAKKTNRPGTEGEPGTGFGMPLVKKYMECYSGSISISSNAENNQAGSRGTTVFLKFHKG